MAKRDANGRYAKGQSGNPGGRPRRVPGYLDVLHTSLTIEKWQAVVDRAIADAMNGNRFAREWLGNYVLGKPEQIVNLSGEIGVTLEDWQQRARERLAEALTTLAEGVNG